jgi:hypothetical protein
MGRSRRTRTREPPGGAHSTPARAIMAGLLQTRNARTGGWADGANARTPTPEARHEPGESEIAEARRPASPTPPPRRGDLSWGMPPAARIVGPEDPRPQPSSRGGANVGSRAPLIGLAGSPGSLPLPSTPPLPGWLQGVMGGPAVGEARRQPPAIIGSNIPGPLTGNWIQDPPRPMEDPG